MNRTSLSTVAGDERQATRASKPWWNTDLAPIDSIVGPLDPEAPRALWRLVNIAEMAGLLLSSSETAMLDAFRTEGKKRSAIAAELNGFKCSFTDLYAFVTLISAAPRGVPLSVLSRETLADPPSLRRSLDHLDAIGAITTQIGDRAEPELELTSSGMNFAVLLTYRVINASIRTRD